MNVFNEEVNAVYRKLDTLFKIKAKKIVKGSGLNFERILSAVDLLTDRKFYILKIDGKMINFTTSRDLFFHLINHCIEELKYKIKYLRDLEYHKQHDMYFDDVGLDPVMSQLRWEEDQLRKYIEHLRSLLSTNKET
jgi:hypothetical protein